MTKCRQYLEEVVPDGSHASQEAEKVRTRLLNEVDERRNPRTRSTINQMLDRYLRDWRGERLTLRGYIGI